MSISSIISLVIILLAIYYVGMIIWDIVKDSLINKEEENTAEEEIDISGNFDGEELQPIVVEVNQSTDKIKMERKKPQYPFPWTPEQIKKAFEKIEMEEECNELANVTYTTKAQYKASI